MPKQPFNTLPGLQEILYPSLCNTSHALEKYRCSRCDFSPFYTDANKLRQVLRNLVGNALKFTPRGQVTVRVESDPVTQQPRRIEVIDTGIGIPAKQLAGIFEHFQQADNRITRHYGGTGLGLTIARSLCQLLGYQLTVHSEVDKGSTFSILIPT